MEYARGFVSWLRVYAFDFRYLKIKAPWVWLSDRLEILTELIDCMFELSLCSFVESMIEAIHSLFSTQAREPVIMMGSL